MSELKALPTCKESLIPTDLLLHFKTGRVLAWVGAGFSQKIGYNSWTQLINTLAAEISSTAWEASSLIDWVRVSGNTNPEWVAEVLSNVNLHQYLTTLKREFKNEGATSISHALLAILPFYGYVTTNYDTLMEDHVRIFSYDRPLVYSHKNAIDLITADIKGKFIFKIHGDSATSSPDEWVLRESDYYRLMKDGMYTKALAWIFSKHVIVCFGYSMRDRDFQLFIQERYHLFKANCPPMYVFVSEKNTCREEINCFRLMYNINLIPVSPDYNFEEIDETLLSLYCLYHHLDSNTYGKDIVNIISSRLNNTAFDGVIIKARNLLCVFKDGIDIDEFNAICIENNISLSTAHITLLGKLMYDKKVICKENTDGNDERVIASKWIKNGLVRIKIGDNPTYLSIYYKGEMNRYMRAISYLLTKEESWDILIGNDLSALERFVKYYQQQGLWKRWLEIAKNALNFNLTEPIKVEVVRSLLFIYFWTRNYQSLSELINEYPDTDSSSGVNAYRNKLSYMNKEGLVDLANKLEENLTASPDYFDISLLGRTYARLSQIDKNNKDDLLRKAERHLNDALAAAVKSKDLVEISIQTWYLALVQIELSNLEDAKVNLAKTKLLDENIMERIPGIAWLRVAEYRFEKKSGSVELGRIRNIAKSAMENLGMIDVDMYLDEEYFY